MSPLSPLRPCAARLCHTLTRGGRCAQHARELDQQRPNADVRLWYHTPRWKQLRAQVLAEEPRCCDCLTEGRTAASTDADHQVPHHGDVVLFWSRANLRGRCHACHARKTRRGE
jgi:5-methylcytosine-specific restriction protein A